MYVRLFFNKNVCWPSILNLICFFFIDPLRSLQLPRLNPHNQVLDTKYPRTADEVACIYMGFHANNIPNFDICMYAHSVE